MKFSLLVILFLFPQFLFSQVKDFFGRNYFIYKEKIQFSLDEDYFPVFPYQNQLAIHIEESKELANRKRVYDAIRLYRGISLCSESYGKFRSYLIESRKELSKLLSSYSDKEKEISIFSGLFGCYTDKELILQTEEENFKLFIDKDFYPIFPKEEKNFTRYEDQYNSKLNYLKIEFSNEASEEKIEDIYFKYSNNIFSEPKNQVTILIGETYHKHKFSKENDYINLWDNRRGLLPSIKKSILFERELDREGFFKTKFQIKNKFSIRNYLGIERYYFFKNKGIFILFTYPEEIQEKGNLLSITNFKIMLK